MGISAVIPQRDEVASPESITSSGGYGFRAHRFAMPRNDQLGTTP